MPATSPSELRSSERTAPHAATEPKRTRARRPAAGPASDGRRLLIGRLDPHGTVRRTVCVIQAGGSEPTSPHTRQSAPRVGRLRAHAASAAGGCNHAARWVRNAEHAYTG